MVISSIKETLDCDILKVWKLFLMLVSIANDVVI